MLIQVGGCSTGNDRGCIGRVRLTWEDNIKVDFK